MKTNKSYAKRLKVSKNGKITARKIGQNHFNAKYSGRSEIRKKRASVIHLDRRSARRFLVGVGK